MASHTHCLTVERPLLQQVSANSEDFPFWTCVLSGRCAPVHAIAAVRACEDLCRRPDRVWAPRTKCCTLLVVVVPSRTCRDYTRFVTVHRRRPLTNTYLRAAHTCSVVVCSGNQGRWCVVCARKVAVRISFRASRDFLQLAASECTDDFPWSEREQMYGSVIGTSPG